MFSNKAAFSTELLSFRRAFLWLVLCVVLPSAGLSGFGVVAIVNERAALEQKRKELSAREEGMPQRSGAEPRGELSQDSADLDWVQRYSTRNRTIYVVLLALFYAALAIGVAITARTLYREAQVSRLKTDFVSLLAHELRTPLTSIRLYIETLALGRVTEVAEVQQAMGVLSKEVFRLSRMVDKVLEWTRLESGRIEQRQVVTSVEGLVQEASEAFQAHHALAPGAYSVDLEAQLPAVRVDVEAMVGALLNLLQNAYKYSGEGRRIRLRARRLGADRVALDVEDNGIGIAIQEQKKVFERFYRVDDLLTRKTEGSGLGLAISERWVRAQGGRIRLRSRLGQGSVFSIELPAWKEEETSA